MMVSYFDEGFAQGGQRVLRGYGAPPPRNKGFAQGGQRALREYGVLLSLAAQPPWLPVNA
jgi:hypothetical protein